MFDGPIDDHGAGLEPEPDEEERDLDKEAETAVAVLRDRLVAGMDAKEITRWAEGKAKLCFRDPFEVALFGAYFRCAVTDADIDANITDLEGWWTLDVAGLFIVAPNPGQVLEHRDELEAA